MRQGIFQIPVLVQRLDQKAQRRRVFGRQAQCQRLAVQVGGQAFVGNGAVAGVQFVVALGQRAARRGVAAPFAIVGAHVHAAVAFPAFVHQGI